MKRLFFFTGTFLLSIFSFLNLTASSDDSVDGEFTTSGNNNDVAIDGFDLKDSEGERTKTLSPQRDYTVTIEVSDLDTIDDLYSLRIVFYNVKDGDDPQTVFEDIDGTPDSGEAADFKWVRDGASEDEPGTGSLSGSSFSGVKHEDHSEEDSIDDYTSWSVASSTTPDSDDADATSFTFELEFQVSKIAPESEDSEWRMGVETVDGWVDNGSSQPTTTAESLSISQDDPVPENVSDGEAFDMNWYGEIDVPHDFSIDWTDVKPDDDFSTPNSRFDTNEDDNNAIGYLSNGEHSREVYSSDTWTAVEDDLPDDVEGASLASGDLSDPQTFGIAINTWDYDKTTRGYSEDNTERLQPSSDGRPSPLEIASTGRIDHDEDPDKQFNSFYLNVSDEFQNAEYEGSITFTITNTDLVATTDSGDVTTGYRSIDEALNDTDAKSLTLLDDIGSDTDEVDLTIDRPMDIDFDEYEVHGDLTVAYDDSVDTNFTGSGSLTGDLTVDTPNASFNSDLDVEGTTDIEAVSPNSFTTSGHHTGDINMRTSGSLTTEDDASDATINVKSSDAVTVSGNAETINIDTENTDLTIDASANINANENASVHFTNQASVNTIDIADNKTVTPDFDKDFDKEGRIKEKTGNGTLDNVSFNETAGKFYSEIQSAVDDADANDTIIVHDGTHNESIGGGHSLNVDVEGLTLKSKNGADFTTIDAEGEDRAIDLDADNVRIEGFTIDNFGEVALYAGEEHTSAVSDFEIVDNVVPEDIGTHGSSVAINIFDANSGLIEGNELNYQADEENQVLQLWDSSNVVVEENLITTSDSSHYNNGIVITGASTGHEIKDNLITGNDSNGGIALSLSSGNGAISDITITGNTIENSNTNGIQVLSEDQNSIDNITIEYNVVDNHDSGVVVAGESSTNIDVNDNNIINNTGSGVRTTLEAPEVDASNNWWGTDDETDVEDNLTEGSVVISPIKDSEISEAGSDME